MNLYDHLRTLREDVPVWLDEFRVGNPFPRDAFFGSRVIYYPGSGTDGDPVKVFGSTHSAHCFVYADYGVTQTTLHEQLAHPEHGFMGYHSVARLSLRQSDLVPHGWAPHIGPRDLHRFSSHFATVSHAPFGFLEVMERNLDRDEDHGARRLAILFLGADGFASYDALFCQRDSVQPPFAAFLKDHGFGGNYDRFGQDGLLERIARRARVFPQYLLVADHTQAWRGFERVPDVDGRVGPHGMRRFLFGNRNDGQSESDPGWPDEYSPERLPTTPRRSTD